MPFVKYYVRRSLPYFMIWLVTTLQITTPLFGFEFIRVSDLNQSSTLNVRLSTRTIRPPLDMISTTLTISDIIIAKPIVGPPSKSAILEDDQRHRMVILTSEDNGDLTAYMLDNIDIAPHVQDLRAQVTARGCSHDRMTITGGLGCVALCLKDIIEGKILP